MISSMRLINSNINNINRDSSSKYYNNNSNRIIYRCNFVILLKVICS